MRTSKLPPSIWRIWWVALLAKAGLGLFLPLFSDETYYWVWGHHLDLSYFDHPPLIGYLFALGRPLDTFFNGARLPAVFLGHASLMIWVKVAEPLLPPARLVWFFVLLLLSPLVLGSTLIATPDTPLLFFAGLTSFAAVKVVFNPRPWGLFILGACLGLAFCSKYLAVLLLVPLMCAHFHVHRSFRIFLQHLPWVTLGFLLFSAPVWIWNFQRDWVSFKFQLQHGLGSSLWDPHWTWDFLAGQILLISPPVLYLVLRGGCRPRPLEAIQPDRTRLVFFWALFLFPMLFFLYSSFKGQVEANWPLLAYPGAIFLSVYFARGFFWAKAISVVWALIFFVFLGEVASKSLARADLVYKSLELVKYDKVVSAAKDFHPLYLRTFQMASRVSFETKVLHYKLHGSSRMDFFDLRPESIPVGTSYFLVVGKYQGLDSWAREQRHVILRRWDIGDERVEVAEVYAP